MSQDSSRKRNQIFAWVLLLVGLVLAGHGLLQLAAGNGERMGQASLGGALMILSTGFFAISRPKKS